MAQKTLDPKIVRLLDERAKAVADCERAYSRLKRAFSRTEKARRKVARLDKRLGLLGVRPAFDLPAGVTCDAE